MRKKTNDEMIEEMVEILKDKSTKDTKEGRVKRGAHSKSLGLLKATFTVSQELDEMLRIGLFKEPKTYPALIRVSKSSSKGKSDKIKDVLGFSIKVLGVECPKLLDDEFLTQDFLFVSTETMPLGTLPLFYDALALNPVCFLFKLLMTGQVKKIKELMSLRKNYTSPLDISYYSTTPYFFGRQVVKYCIVPTSRYQSDMPERLTDQYLTDNMEKHLNQSEASFDFLIQFQKEQMPLDDASVKWDESISPFIKVGEINILAQQFKTEQREEISELLSFNPGHCGLKHEPLGGLNKARMRMYYEMSLFRHAQNNRPLFEPTLSDYEIL